MGAHSTKKLLLNTLGIRDVSREQVEEIAEEMVEKGELRRGDSKGFIMEIMGRARREREELRGALEDIFENLLETIGVVTRNDLTDLNDRIEGLQRSLDKLIARQEAPAPRGAAGKSAGKTHPSPGASKKTKADGKGKKKAASKKSAAEPPKTRAAKKKTAGPKGAKTRKK